MFIMSLYKFIWLFYIILFRNAVLAVEYQIVLENEDVLSPCKDYPDNYISDLLDLSKLKFELTSETNVHIHGDIKVVKELSDVPIQLDGQVYKKKGGEWVNTVYNMQREDFCRALWETGEFWYKFVSEVPKDKKTCPFANNLVIGLDFNSELTMDVPDRKVDGDYKAEVKLIAGDEWFVCFDILFTAVKM